MSTSPVAEAFPVGEHLADELEARGWTQADFAVVLDRPSQFVSEIISGKKEITRESATQIAAALGTSAELWLNIQDSYLLWRRSQNPEVSRDLDAVRRRARLRELAPVRLLVDRGFIGPVGSAGHTRDLLNLLGMRSLDDEPRIQFAARRSNATHEVTVDQRAWVACVKALADDLRSAAYDKRGLDDLSHQLSVMARDPARFSDFQSLLLGVGVKVVYVRSFPGSKLDGCAMLSGGVPVIGLSGRGKRLDKVLFTLLHEIAHILLGHLDDDGAAIIDDLDLDPTGIEKAADDLAAGRTIPHPLPDPPAMISSEWIERQAERCGVHRIVVVGRLQKVGLLPWRTSLVRGAPNVVAQLESWGPRPGGRLWSAPPGGQARRAGARL